VDVLCRAPILVGRTRPVANQATIGDERRERIDRRQSIARRKRDDEMASLSRNPLAVTIKPLFGEPAKVATPRSISLPSRTTTELTCTPWDGATDWIAANWPIPAGLVASRMTAARVTPGAISLSSSSHFALMPYSNRVKPVALPPGRARLSTKPAATGSVTFANTIGTVLVAACKASVA